MLNVGARRRKNDAEQVRALAPCVVEDAVRPCFRGLAGFPFGSLCRRHSCESGLGSSRGCQSCRSRAGLPGCSSRGCWLRGYSTQGCSARHAAPHRCYSSRCYNPQLAPRRVRSSPHWDSVRRRCRRLSHDSRYLRHLAGALDPFQEHRSASRRWGRNNHSGGIRRSGHSAYLHLGDSQGRGGSSHSGQHIHGDHRGRSHSDRDPRGDNRYSSCSARCCC